MGAAIGPRPLLVKGFSNGPTAFSVHMGSLGDLI
jgi:hypothetical protein